MIFIEFKVNMRMKVENAENYKHVKKNIIKLMYTDMLFVRFVRFTLCLLFF